VAGAAEPGRKPHAGTTAKPRAAARPDSRPPQPARDERKRLEVEARKKQKAEQARKARIDAIEARIAETEAAIRTLESRMAAPGFYDDRAASKKAADEHQSLMWTVGDLMQQWEDMQTDSTLAPTTDR
jgi:hypothetical protein